jgi:hypothetical protein
MSLMCSRHHAHIALVLSADVWQALDRLAIQQYVRCYALAKGLQNEFSICGSVPCVAAHSRSHRTRSFFTDMLPAKDRNAYRPRIASPIGLRERISIRVAMLRDKHVSCFSPLTMTRSPLYSWSLTWRKFWRCLHQNGLLRMRPEPTILTVGSGSGSFQALTRAWVVGTSKVKVPKTSPRVRYRVRWPRQGLPRTSFADWMGMRSSSRSIRRMLNML